MLHFCCCKYNRNESEQQEVVWGGLFRMVKMDLTVHAVLEHMDSYSPDFVYVCVSMLIILQTLCCTLCWTEPCCLTDAQGKNILPYHTHSAYLLWRVLFFKTVSGNVIILTEFIWSPLIWFLCWWLQTSQRINLFVIAHCGLK